MDQDLDQAFENSVASLDLDTSGDLVDRLTLDGKLIYLLLHFHANLLLILDIFGRFVSSWKEAAFVWLDACGFDDDCESLVICKSTKELTNISVNGQLFTIVLCSFVENLNIVLKSILSALCSSQLPPLPIPTFKGDINEE